MPYKCEAVWLTLRIRVASTLFVPHNQLCQASNFDSHNTSDQLRSHLAAVCPPPQTVILGLGQVTSACSAHNGARPPQRRPGQSW